jgi:hypothetical protein
MTEERFAEIQRELEAIEASPAPETFEACYTRPFLLMLVALERQGVCIEELATRLSHLEAEVRVLARRAEGQDAGV